MIRDIENLLRKAALYVGLLPQQKIEAVKVGHQVDNLVGGFFTATGAESATLEAVGAQIQWLIDILDGTEVREEWSRLFKEECAKPGNENGINAYQDWPLRRIAYDNVQRRRQGANNANTS